MLSMGLNWFRALMATSDTMVVQLGLEMMPLCHFTSSGLISGITSGTSLSRRKALELSTNTAPALTMAGAYCLAMSFSAAPSTRSRPSKALSAAATTSTSPPLKGSFVPALRSLAMGRSSATGNLRSSRIFIISRPTAPVAPRIPTLNCFILQLPPLQSCHTGHEWPAQNPFPLRPR